MTSSNKGPKSTNKDATEKNTSGCKTEGIYRNGGQTPASKCNYPSSDSDASTAAVHTTQSFDILDISFPRFKFIFVDHSRDQERLVNDAVCVNESVKIPAPQFSYLLAIHSSTACTCDSDSLRPHLEMKSNGLEPLPPKRLFRKTTK